MTPQEKLIDMAKSYVGYIEKKSNKDLDSFTTNAGLNNYTKFARDYKNISDIDAQAQPWCDVFVDMMFVYTFGKDLAKKMLGGFSAYTPQSAQYFQAMGRYFKKPAVGDVIFFKNSERIYHTGIVYYVDSDTVYTIEGNTSSAKGVVENGGCVAKKYYALNYSKIDGYGRPLYNLIKNEEELTMTQYEELNGRIDSMVATINSLSRTLTLMSAQIEGNKPMVYNYMDNNMPAYARPTIQKMMDKGLLKGNEKGELGLTDELLKVFVTNDRAGLYD